MKSQTTYTAHTANPLGYIDYDDIENNTWQILYKRQIDQIKKVACQEYIDGVNALNFSKKTIPQLPDINEVLYKSTGWSVEAVPCLINFERFFSLLANRKFPVATFIRTPEEIDYLKEPDIFHELFGHCPLLTNQSYADFVENYGKLGLKASSEERVYLARLFWFTIEFGLIKNSAGTKVYGGGILSSPSETIYSLTNQKPLHRKFDPLQIMRTPYKIDQLQKVYYEIDHLDDLKSLLNLDLMKLVKQAQQLGLEKSLYH